MEHTYISLTGTKYFHHPGTNIFITSLSRKKGFIYSADLSNLFIKCQGSLLPCLPCSYIGLVSIIQPSPLIHRYWKSFCETYWNIWRSSTNGDLDFFHSCTAASSWFKWKEIIKTSPFSHLSFGHSVTWWWWQTDRVPRECDFEFRSK